MTNPNDATLKSWIDVSPESDFPIQNLPYGVFRRDNGAVAVGVAIGEMVMDLATLFDAGLLPGICENNIFRRDSLNDFMALGRQTWSQARQRISELLRSDCGELRDNQPLREQALIAQNKVQMLLPIRVSNFVDFYSSLEHATNVGKMFRPDNPLLPNWKHIPIGYNGRASSVVVSGTDIIRPKGQTKPDDGDPQFGPCRLLDIELEMGFITGMGNQLGTSISTAQAPEYIFGMVLLNDWSARDIQKWEYVPLGPFLGKSFGTSISPWVITLDALDPFRVAGPAQEPKVLANLECEGNWGYDIHLEAHLQTPTMAKAERITATNFRGMYWNMPQQLAHLTSNGTNVQTGDLYGSGTVSGTAPDSLGSLLELCWKGTRPLEFANGEKRTFLQDGDSIILKGWCHGQGYRVGFGECRGKILPSL